MDLMKTEAHPFDGVGENKIGSARGDSKKDLLALRRKHQKLLMPTTSNKNES